MDGIFQVVRAFDDAEVIHVEGDVNPLRDMEIISTELRLKDIEWVEKKLDAMKKGKPLTNTSLADKAKKEEIACTEKVLDLIKTQNKDVRKGDWSNKEVRNFSEILLMSRLGPLFLPGFFRLTLLTRCNCSRRNLSRTSSTCPNVITSGRRTSGTLLIHV